MRVQVHLSLRPHDPDSDPTFIATIDEIAGEPTVELELDKHDDESLICLAVTVRKTRGIASRDIRIPIERYLDDVSHHPALKGSHAQRLRSRRRITDEFLADVAAAYIENGGSVDGIEDLDHRFNAADSTKFRWLRAARERGLLPPRDADGER